MTFAHYAMSAAWVCYLGLFVWTLKVSLRRQKEER